jgi:conjugative relaxase-like TrwC/TraI family protein
MLTVHRLTTNRASYYLSDLARELPPPRAPTAPGGEWTGALAARLGLHGPIEGRRFEATLNGRHPENGHPLRSDRARVLAYDLTFSAPKSASVLLALGGEEVARQIVDGHADAVRHALSYVEAHAVSAVRRTGGDAEILATDGLVAGAFTHGVNRNMDPHLHTHVVAANLVHGVDSRWGVLDQRGLWAHQRAAGSVYTAHLRTELTTRLGVRWTQAPFRPAEIDGVAPQLIGEFSSRAADIRRHEFDHGGRSARANRIAWAATRPAKGKGMPFETLAGEWRQRADAVMLSWPELTSVLAHRPPARAAVNEHQFAGVLSTAADGCARRRDLVTAFAESARDGAAAETVQSLTDAWLPGDGERVGVSEPAHPLRHVVPGPHLLRALGDRPLSPFGQEVWRQAATSIDDYRQRWRVSGPEALGAEQCQSEWSTRRMVDHLRTVALLDTARARLGQRQPMVVELGRAR